MLEIRDLILGYLLGLIDVDKYIASLRTLSLSLAIKIRTSEDVRGSKNIKVRSYLLFATFTEHHHATII